MRKKQVKMKKNLEKTGFSSLSDNSFFPHEVGGFFYRVVVWIQPLTNCTVCFTDLDRYVTWWWNRNFKLRLLHLQTYLKYEAEIPDAHGIIFKFIRLHYILLWLQHHGIIQKTEKIIIIQSFCWLSLFSALLPWTFF